MQVLKGLTRFIGVFGIALLILRAGVGCTTPPLAAARQQYALGNFENANNALSTLPDNDKDKVLYLMERGMIRQSAQKYDDSTRDWLEAVKLEKDLETHSAGRAAASMLVNDKTLSFRGMYFERVLIHSFLAKNFLAKSLWDDAAVEARNVIEKLQLRENFPDDAYSRYLAGVCLELSGDYDNAPLQYSIASKLARFTAIDPRTGRLSPSTAIVERIESSATTPAHPPAKLPGELICFVSMGQIPSYSSDKQPRTLSLSPPYAEFYHKGVYLGRSYALVNTADLEAETRKQLAARKAAKEISRLATKIAISDSIAQHNEAVGALLQILLIAMEQPDTRRWQSLPYWLEAARLPCPKDLTEYEVVFRNSGIASGTRRTVATPLSHRRNTYISFIRDIECRDTSAVHAASTPSVKK